MNRSRLEDLEARLAPHPQVVLVRYLPDSEEDRPLTEQELELYRELLEEALEAAPDAVGYALFLNPANPRWEVWPQPEAL